MRRPIRAETRIDCASQVPVDEFEGTCFRPRRRIRVVKGRMSGRGRGGVEAASFEFSSTVFHHQMFVCLSAGWIC